MALSRTGKANLIIHSFAAAAAAWSGAWAYAPVVGPALADTAGLTAITIAMTYSLAALFNKKLDEGSMWSFGAVILGWAAGNALLKSAWSLVPIYGSVVNATITFGLHEAIGWALYLIFDEGKDPTKLSKKEFMNFLSRGKEKAASEKEAYEKMKSKLSYDDKRKVEELEKQLSKKGLSTSEREAISRRITDIFEKYN